MVCSYPLSKYGNKFLVETNRRLFISAVFILSSDKGQSARFSLYLDISLISALFFLSMTFLRFFQIIRFIRCCIGLHLCVKFRFLIVVFVCVG